VNSLFVDYNFDDIFDIEDDEGVLEAEAIENELTTIDDMFKAALSGTYEKIKEDKDKGLKSEKSGHTVAANLETAKSIINYLKNWIDIVGNRLQLDQTGVLTKNISSVTGLYAMMDSVGMLGEVNLLEKFFGLESMVLPVDLSALAVVDTVYS